MKTLKEETEVMQAALDNKEIEWKRPIKSDKWENFCYETNHFNWTDYDYRIKPVPMEFYIVLNQDGHLFSTESTRNNAENVLRNDAKSGSIIKVREVME